jgi:hypothetical protein
VIHFACPTCRAKLECPERKAGHKTPCPNCGQRLQVPSPEHNKTVLGSLLPESGGSRRNTGAEASVACPGCGRSIPLQPQEIRLTFEIECSRCQTRFVSSGLSGQVPAPSEPVSDPALLGLVKDNQATGLREGIQGALYGDPSRKHSGLGMASFVIALVVGGLDVILAVVISVGIARSGHRAVSVEALKAEVVSGSLAMVCLNCMSLPVCLVGVGLAIVGLIGHRDRNHLFTWIGLVGNGLVVATLLGLYLFGSMVGN